MENSTEIKIFNSRNSSANPKNGVSYEEKRVDELVESNSNLMMHLTVYLHGFGAVSVGGLKCVSSNQIQKKVMFLDIPENFEIDAKWTKNDFWF